MSDGPSIYLPQGGGLTIATPGAVGPAYKQMAVVRPLRVPILLVEVPELAASVPCHRVQWLIVERIRKLARADDTSSQPQQQSQQSQTQSQLVSQPAS